MGAQRHSKFGRKTISYGTYENEETATHASDTFARKLVANGEQGHKLNFPHDDKEIVPEKKTKSSQYFGVWYDVNATKWRGLRRSKHEKKTVHNGSYENEETAAHASDTFARKLIANGEKGHQLNFPDDEFGVFPEEKTKSSQYIGVSYELNTSRWRAFRRSKHEKKDVYNGRYETEEAAAHASDTLARKFLANGEQDHKLNFPEDDSEVFPEKTKTKSSQYTGVSYNTITSKWQAQRRSKPEKKDVYNGRYETEEAAARASDLVARKLMANGEQGHKLNFPDDDTEVFPEKLQRKRKRTHHKHLGHPKNN